MKNQMRRWFVAMCVWGLAGAAWSDAGERWVWPAADCAIEAHSASTVALRADRAAEVAVTTGYAWPGVTVRFKKGWEDLSSFGFAEVAVSNRTDRSIIIYVSVKTQAQQGGDLGGSVVLKPFGTGTIRTMLCRMPWKLDAPLELVGMNGYPAPAGRGRGILQKVTSFHVFMVNPTQPAAFTLASIRLLPGGIPVKTLSAATFLPFVDEFGQFKHDDWPGKVHGEAELIAARDREDAWLAAHAESPIPGADRFGGWGAGPQQKATGFFRTEKVKGKWWLVDPDGHLFFSQGIDCIQAGNQTGIGQRESYFAWIPKKDDPRYRSCFSTGWGAAHSFYKTVKNYSMFSFSRANLIRLYGEDFEPGYFERVHRRLHAWGINTIANWSNPKAYLLHKTPYTVCLNTSGPSIEGSSGWWGKFPDPFSKPFADNLAARIQSEVKVGTDRDPWCIGYFVDNELSWGVDDRSLARDTLRSPANQPAKLAFRDALQKSYRDIAALNAAWGTGYADWGAFLAATNLPEEKRCGKDLEVFHSAVAEHYYRTIRDAIRAVAPNRLYLGSRIAWGAPSVYRAAAKYSDVVSVNAYMRIPQGDLPPGSEDKPMIIGEFHFGALDRGLFHTGLQPTRDQAERAACYRDYLRACLAHPRCVGAHWFQWRDQPLTGRSDGENYQIGFVTVTDAPYPELVAAAREIAAILYENK